MQTKQQKSVIISRYLLEKHSGNIQRSKPGSKQIHKGTGGNPESIQSPETKQYGKTKGTDSDAGSQETRLTMRQREHTDLNREERWR